MGIRTAWKVLFEPEPAKNFYTEFDKIEDLYSRKLTNEELITELLAIRKHCNLKEIQVIQQAASQLGWWG